MIRDRVGDPDFVILDVRTPQEYEMGRIEDSVNIDYHSPTFEADLEKLDRNKTYLVYCLVGIRSANAAKIMERLSFEDVRNMLGGIRQWHLEGLPIVGR
ncbi:MAG TPA: rhodanese-like domain-containing protein [Methanotrichaceae archaeon]|nr:rhodanese-like domain-containing protein [Methanotrichaceae archaeon]